MPEGELPVRELLWLSQTNVTSDAIERYDYAQGAYSVAMTPEVMLEDPNAAGEAAAKAGFNGAIAHQPIDDVNEWFTRSFQALPRDRHDSARERIATHLLEGRALGFLAIRDNVKSLETMADTTFENGSGILTEQHRTGRSWDPYGTMFSAHRATFEATRDHGDVTKAIAVAGLGMWQAIRSRREQANSPIGLVKHSLSIVKHAGMNVLAGSLAATRPLDAVKPIARARRSIALKLLGST